VLVSLPIDCRYACHLKITIFARERLSRSSLVASLQRGWREPDNVQTMVEELPLLRGVRFKHSDLHPDFRVALVTIKAGLPVSGTACAVDELRFMGWVSWCQMV
tara:strand:- start:71 stop:382 length:312 start_codon:yes stop_codon:yes gene_type:complete